MRYFVLLFCEIILKCGFSNFYPMELKSFSGCFASLGLWAAAYDLPCFCGITAKVSCETPTYAFLLRCHHTRGERGHISAAAAAAGLCLFLQWRWKGWGRPGLTQERSRWTSGISCRLHVYLLLNPCVKLSILTVFSISHRGSTL